MKKFLLTPIFMASALAFSSACDQGPTPDIGIEVYGPDGQEPFQNTSWIRLSLDGNGLPKPIQNTVPYRPMGSLDIGDIPFTKEGDSLQLTVEGLEDQDGQPGRALVRGRSPILTVDKDSESLKFKVLVSPTNGMTALKDREQRQAQVLQFGRVGHQVTATQNEMVITGGGLLESKDALWWKGQGLRAVHAAVEGVEKDRMRLSGRGNMRAPRLWHSATAISSGQIIIAGGYNQDAQAQNSVELYNPPGINQGESQWLKPMSVARSGHSATLLDADSWLILFVGGDERGTWEVWDPDRGSHGIQSLPEPRRLHQATLFYKPGKTSPGVLISGGESPARALSSILLFDSSQKNMLTVNQPMPNGARTMHEAIYVPERDFIYLLGGYSDLEHKNPIPYVEVYESNKDRFRGASLDFRLLEARGGAAAVGLNDNRIMISGGLPTASSPNAESPLMSMESIFETVNGNSININFDSSDKMNGSQTLKALPEGRMGHRMAYMDGMALIVGGVSDNGDKFKAANEVFVYNPF